MNKNVILALSLLLSTPLYAASVDMEDEAEIKHSHSFNDQFEAENEGDEGDDEAPLSPNFKAQYLTATKGYLDKLALKFPFFDSKNAYAEDLNMLAMILDTETGREHFGDQVFILRRLLSILAGTKLDATSKNDPTPAERMNNTIFSYGDEFARAWFSKDRLGNLIKRFEHLGQIDPSEAVVSPIMAVKILECFATGSIANMSEKNHPKCCR